MCKKPKFVNFVQGRTQDLKKGVVGAKRQKFFISLTLRNGSPLFAPPLLFEQQKRWTLEMLWNTLINIINMYDN